MAEDYYKTLGVPRDASQADIQKAYRELARKHHPDLNPDDKTAKKRFQGIQAAYEVLNNPEKRELYDRYGSSFETRGAGGPGGSQGGYRYQWSPGAGAGPSGLNPEDIDFAQFFGERFGDEGAGGFGDIFSQFRGAGGSKSRRSARGRGQDLLFETTIPLPVAISGGVVPLTVPRPNGKDETIDVRVPAGIEDGKKIRLRGQGQPGPRGGTPGDLLILVRIAPHPFYSRQGNNLVVRVPVTLAEAALGAKVDVPGPNGVMTLTVPAGTSSGTKLRVKGHGVRPKDGPPGDLLAEILIVLPKHLTEDDREAIREIDRRNPLSPRAHLQWQ